MTKIRFAMLLGGFLGVFDGLSALISAPETAPGIVGIVIGSTIKGLITGAIIGAVAKRRNSLPLGIGVGLATGLGLATLVALMPDNAGRHYYWQIMLPGALLGVIVGYATQRHQVVSGPRPGLG
jgi:hypothetical protein